jgi:hypothetical protein
MTNTKKSYLGDGLYAEDDRDTLKLWAERDYGKHYVCLEPEVLQSLFEFLERSRGLKIKVERVEGDWK